MSKKVLFLAVAVVLCAAVTSFAEEAVAVDGPVKHRVLRPLFVRPVVVCPVVVVEQPTFVESEGFHRGLHNNFTPVTVYTVEGQDVVPFGRIVPGIAPCGTAAKFQRAKVYRQTLHGHYRLTTTWVVVD
ncbi:hypothetical protein FACS1894170_05310 [Planctomycetales bacterium]|nr:hypothetical protein FACS1894170_05310 [Planctomycetales bacterium]